MRPHQRQIGWTAATLTGGLALILMLGWQTFALIDHASASDPDKLTTQLREKEQPALQSGIQPPPKSEEPAVEATIIKVVRREVPDPSPGADVGNPFADSPADNTESPIHKTAVNDNPFETTPVRNEAKREIPAAIKTVSLTTETTDRLSLELIRIGESTPSSEPSTRFLTTSLSAAPIQPAPSVGLLDHAGWTAVRWSPRGKDILPVRYIQETTSPAERPASGEPIALSANGTADWTINTHRLQYDILLPSRARVGERVPIRLRIINTGTAAAENVKLQIDLPDELAYSVGRRLTHSVGSLKPGEQHVARLTPVAVQSGEVAVTGTAIADNITQSDRQRLRIESTTQTVRRYSVSTSASSGEGISVIRCCGGP